MGMWLKTQEFFPCVFVCVCVILYSTLLACAQMCADEVEGWRSALDIFFLDLMLSIQAGCSIYSTLFIYLFFPFGSAFGSIPKGGKGIGSLYSSFLNGYASGYCMISPPASTYPTNLLNYKFHQDSYFICFVGCPPIAPKTAPSIE